MIADARLYAGGFRPALHDAIGVLLAKGFVAQAAGFSGGRTEQIAIVIAGDAGSLDILVEQMIEIMMAGNIMLFATFLVKADPSAAALHEIICDLHLKDGADTGKAVDHDADESAIAQTQEIGLAGIGAFLRGFANRDAVEQRA